MKIALVTVPSLLASVMAVYAAEAGSQTYPNKPIHIVTAPPAGGGGGGDFITRLVAQGMSASLGQPVIIDNRPTATIGAFVSKAPADGYTLALLGNSFWISPLIEKTSYDPVSDFSAISLINRAPQILVVHPSLPVKSVKELIALAKARPGEVAGRHQYYRREFQWRRPSDHRCA
jgi:tripartite-type tricarboxylate transporter receptor subunit TctC